MRRETRGREETKVEGTIRTRLMLLVRHGLEVKKVSIYVCIEVPGVAHARRPIIGTAVVILRLQRVSDSATSTPELVHPKPAR